MATILCIEDEDMIRQDIVEELTDAGHDVMQASDGSEGLKLLLSKMPDLVLCDISMPVMDGHTLLTELRESYPEHDDLPFVFLSALADRDDVIAGKKLGADDYLTKPIDFEMLHATIESRLRQVGRMSERKQDQMVRLYKALTPGTAETLSADAAAADQSSESRKFEPLDIAVVASPRSDAHNAAIALQDSGHKVRLFANGGAYVDDAEASKAELILVSPSADGSGEDAFIMAIAAAAAPVVLLETQQASNATGEESLPQGFDVQLHWTGDIDAFSTALRAIMEGRMALPETAMAAQ